MLDSGDDIGARLALHRYDDGRLVVHPAGQIHILRSHDRPADITHANRSARAKGTSAVGDDVVVEPLHRLQLVVCLQRKGLVGAV
jgi:hypothetical protein